MYRKALAMEQERIAQETFIGKVTSLPVVNSAWAQVFIPLYSNGLSHHTYSYNKYWTGHCVLEGVSVIFSKL